MKDISGTFLYIQDWQDINLSILLTLLPNYLVITNYILNNNKALKYFGLSSVFKIVILKHSVQIGK